MRGRPASLRHGVTAAGVGALALLAQLPILARSIVPVDEGQLLAIAERLRHGEALYRDIYTGIFPGIYWAAALLLGAFGEDAATLRWAQALVNAATSSCLWLLGRRVARPLWAALAPLLYVALVAFDFPGLSMLNYSPVALLFAMAALLFLLRQLESGRAGDGLAAGLCLAASGLVKQNFGALAALALAGVFAWSWVAAGRRRQGLLRALAPIAGGGLAVVAAALAALVATDALPDFMRQTLLAIHRSQLEAFRDPFPPVFGSHPSDDPRFVFVYTPSALYNYLVRGEAIFGIEISPALRGASIRLAYGGAIALLAAGLALLRFERGGTPRSRRDARAVVVFAVCLFPGIFPSAIWSHLAFVAAPVLLVLSLVCDRLSRVLEQRAPPAARAWQALVGALALAALLVACRISLDLRRWYPVPLGVPRAALYVGAEDRARLSEAVRFLARCARPGEPVFVAPDLPILYFLADRRNPTPYDLVIPGEVDESVILDRLAATRTRCVVYNPKMYLQFAPFEELFPEVAAHLASAYRRVAVIGAGETQWYGLVLGRNGGS